MQSTLITNYIKGNYLSPNKCKIYVGNFFYLFRIEFYICFELSLRHLRNKRRVVYGKQIKLS